MNEIELKIVIIIIIIIIIIGEVNKKTMQLPVTWHQLPLLYNQSSWLMDKSGKCGDPYPLEKQMYQVYFSQS